MDLKGEYRIRAPRDFVWGLINDPRVLKDCIPGCSALEGSPEDGFEAKVTTKIGPVKATFAGAVQLTNVNAPESYTISGEGKGGVAGFAKGGADVHLAQEGEETVLTYLAKAQVGGKLAQLGSRLIDSTAKKLADEFFANLTAYANASADAPAPAGDPQTASEIAAPAEKAAPAAPVVAAKPSGSGRVPYILGGLAAAAVLAALAIAFA